MNRKSKISTLRPDLGKEQHCADDTPLCVDLDGTLVHTDLFVESLAELANSNFLSLFLLPIWLARGKAYLKNEIARRVTVDVESLPYNEPFVEYLRGLRIQGRTLVLATASNEKLAHQIAEHLQLFDRVIASDAHTNVAGFKKLERLIAAFGENGFDYAGNGRPDLRIWPSARRAVLVNPEWRVESALEKLGPPDKKFHRHRAGPADYLHGIRVHQWVKNLLVFVPLAASQQFDNEGSLVNSLIAFCSFSLGASSGYLLDDLLDLKFDRQHPHKQARPLASGAIDVKHGIYLAPLLLITAFGVAQWLSLWFSVSLAAYFSLTIAYSVWLKRKPISDVSALAALYTLRILAGATAIAVFPPFWLLAVCIFLFLSLAMVKRYTQSRELLLSDKVAVKERGFHRSGLAKLRGLGITSGCIASLALAFYFYREDVANLYGRPEIIWLLCPLLLFWLGYVWFKATRGEIHDDPVVFAFTDRASQITALIALVVLYTAAIV